MGSSKKHKRHKDKDKKGESESTGEIKPLKLVLKVPHNTAAFANDSSPGHSVDSSSQSPHKIMTFGTTSFPSEPQSSSSTKKMKKKKSKKKHRKHSHHHSRHRHHSHHHRHRGSCSHHSRSQVQEPSAVTSVTLPPIPTNKSPQKSSSKGTGKSQFQLFLTHLLKQLQRKDVQQFFAWPVSDLIAPGYSSIIQHPMDLSTMRQKIDQNQYETLLDFKSDIKLMCDNAMKYNRPETVYFKAANKLWHHARAKLLNKDALVELARSYPGLSSYELGFHFQEVSGVEVVDAEMPEALPNGQCAAPTDGEVPTPVEQVPELQEAEMLDEDGMTPEQILEEARKAAAAAADRLTLQRPKGVHFSFLRQRNDGSTSLSIVGNHEAEKVINLEQLAGKIHEGTAALNPFIEPDVNRVKPLESLPEAPFSSYLPSIDSSKANLNEEESLLLMSAYGDDEVGVQYAQSLTSFAHDTDYVLHLVDSLLDVLTHGQHTRIAGKLKEQRIESENANRNASIQTNVGQEAVNDIQEQLNEASGLINQLESIQHQRLSSSTQTVKPSSEEEQLANQLSSKLTDIISNCANPADVADVCSLRKAMGITIKTEK